MKYVLITLIIVFCACSKKIITNNYNSETEQPVNTQISPNEFNKLQPDEPTPITEPVEQCSIISVEDGSIIVKCDNSDIAEQFYPTVQPPTEEDAEDRQSTTITIENSINNTTQSWTNDDLYIDNNNSVSNSGNVDVETTADSSVSQSGDDIDIVVDDSDETSETPVEFCTCTRVKNKLKCKKPKKSKEVINENL